MFHFVALAVSNEKNCKLKDDVEGLEEFPCQIWALDIQPFPYKLRTMGFDRCVAFTLLKGEATNARSA